MRMAPLAVYADATALIGLARINRLELIMLLSSSVAVTTRVRSEVADDPDKPGVAALVQARNQGLLLILLAKRRGQIDAVRPFLDDLIQQSFWISPAFYEDVLRQAGEG